MTLKVYVCPGCSALALGWPEEVGHASICARPTRLLCERPGHLRAGVRDESRSRPESGLRRLQTKAAVCCGYAGVCRARYSADTGYCAAGVACSPEQEPRRSAAWPRRRTRVASGRPRLAADRPSLSARSEAARFLLRAVPQSPENRSRGQVLPRLRERHGGWRHRPPPARHRPPMQRSVCSPWETFSGPSGAQEALRQWREMFPDLEVEMAEFINLDGAAGVCAGRRAGGGATSGAPVTLQLSSASRL